jgi:hypothetical protein
MVENYEEGRWYTTDKLISPPAMILKYKCHDPSDPRGRNILYSEKCSKTSGLVSQNLLKIWNANNDPKDIRLATEEELRELLPKGHPDHPDTVIPDIRQLIAVEIHGNAKR